MNEIIDKVAKAIKETADEPYEIQAHAAVEAVCKELERLYGQTDHTDPDEFQKAHISHEMIQDLRR